MKYDGSSQGIPLCSLHTDSRETLENADGSSKSERFDWIFVLHEITTKTTTTVINAPVQLCCLVEVQHNFVSEFWFIGAEGKNCPEVRGDREYTPFPKIQYNLTRQGDYKFIFDRVDAVNEPAFVIPVSLRVEDYLFQRSTITRSSIRFTSVPFGFLFRDDWGEGINYGLINIHEAWRSIPCISDSWEDTDTAYLELKKTLSRNAVNGERVLEDDDAIDDYDEVVDR